MILNVCYICGDSRVSTYNKKELYGFLRLYFNPVKNIFNIYIQTMIECLGIIGGRGSNAAIELQYQRRN